jgi:hypothetical protein
MSNKSREQRIFTVLAYSDDSDREHELEYQTVLALDEDEAIEYCGGIDNVLDIFEGTFDDLRDLYEDDEPESDSNVSLYTVVHFEDGELLYTDVIASSASEACSWFSDVFDVYAASLGNYGIA